MCGICGIWGEVDPEIIPAMVNAMHHRGPDDRGTFHDGSIALGMTRLAIIDVTPSGHQPMKNEEGTVWIVYNGEVFNFKSERELLKAKGYSFHSSSDTEVVLRMYECYGDSFLLRLRGMFALAIYDKRRGPGLERLLLARDPLGIKPLLFARAGQRLIFASEIKALLASGLISPEIDPVALRLLLTYGSVYQPRTILRGVSMLLPAHSMTIERHRERIERYWSLGLGRRSGLATQPYEELVPQVAETLRESVRLHMVSDVPIGGFLSGGVDSSFLVGLMTEIAGRRVKTFSVGFEAEGASIDETREAERTAQFLGSDHTRILIRGGEVRDRITHLVQSLDQPSVNGVNSYFVSFAAREAVKVAISGTGGDEIFAGYPWFTQMALYKKKMENSSWKSLCHPLIGKLARFRGFDRFLWGSFGPKISRFRKIGGFIAQYAQSYQIFGPLGAALLLSPDMREMAQAGRAPDYDLKPLDELANGGVVDRVTGLCLRGYTNNQLLRDIDAVSMAHSLEVRVPFLDVSVIDFSLSLPASARLSDAERVTEPHDATYRESGSKKILIDVGRWLGILPEDIDCQPKRGFSLPLDSWLKGPLRQVFDDALSPQTVRARGLLEEKAVGALRHDFLNGRAHWTRPWLLIVLELWCREGLQANVRKYA